MSEEERRGARDPQYAHDPTLWPAIVWLSIGLEGFKRFNLERIILQPLEKASLAV